MAWGVMAGGLGDTGCSSRRRGVLPARPEQRSAATSEHRPASVTPAGMVVQAGKAQGMVVQGKNYPLVHSQLYHAGPATPQKVPGKKPPWQNKPSFFCLFLLTLEVWKRPQPQQSPGHLGVVPTSDMGDGSHPPAPAHPGPTRLCQTTGTRVWSPFPRLGWWPEAGNASPPPAAAFPVPPPRCFLYLPKDTSRGFPYRPPLCSGR